MALTWDDKSRKDQSGRVVSVSYRAQIPHWGEACIHTHIQYPGEMFLECHALGIKMYPLGKFVEWDAMDPAEAVLLRTLKQHAEWCLEAMVDTGTRGCD